MVSNGESRAVAGSALCDKPGMMSEMMPAMIDNLSGRNLEFIHY
jgi:hypothetical protein